MKTILITGGSNGLGKGLAMAYLKRGDQILVVGSSTTHGTAFLQEAAQLGATDRAVYLQADLSLIVENRRLIEKVNKQVSALDALIFCATKHSAVYTETAEGLELTFALDYLSRFLLSYGLKGTLEKAAHPVILNICGSGMKGEVDWDDLQHKKQFAKQKVMMHGSRLNDLSGVAFAQNDSVGKIKYILYNPWAVQTPGMLAMFPNPLLKGLYKLMGKPVKKAILPIMHLPDRAPVGLSAYRENKPLALSLPPYNKENAQKLYQITHKIVESVQV